LQAKGILQLICQAHLLIVQAPLFLRGKTLKFEYVSKADPKTTLDPKPLGPQNPTWCFVSLFLGYLLYTS